jgi:hypothetical protein
MANRFPVTNYTVVCRMTHTVFKARLILPSQVLTVTHEQISEDLPIDYEALHQMNATKS